MDFTNAPRRNPTASQPPRLTLDSPVFKGACPYASRTVEYERIVRPTDQPLEEMVSTAAMRVVGLSPLPQAASQPTPQAKQTPASIPASPQPNVVVAPAPMRTHVELEKRQSPSNDRHSSWDEFYASNPRETLTAEAIAPRLRGKYLLYALAAVFLLIGIVGSLMFFRQYHALQTTVNAAPDTTAQPESSDTNLATSSFTVASADETPVSDGSFSSALYTISIDSLRIKAPVFAMKLQDNGVLQVPKNIYNVGWYDQSAKPGESGASFMLGHVNGPTKAGVFAHLDRLKEGDLINVKNGDKEISYKVVSMETKKVSDIDMSTMLNSAVPGSRGLNIMSCDDTSHFNAKDHTYDGRVIVRAVEQ